MGHYSPVIERPDVDCRAYVQHFARPTEIPNGTDVGAGDIELWCISDRMKSRLTVATLESAVARWGSVAGCVFIPIMGRNFAAGNSSAPWAATAWSGRWVGAAGDCRQRRDGNRSLRCSNATSSADSVGSHASSRALRSSPRLSEPTAADAVSSDSAD